MDYPLVVLVNQLIHIVLDLVGIVIIVSSYPLAFELCFLSSVLHNGNNTLYIFGTIIGFVIDLAVCQSSVVTQGLQCAWADVKHPAHVLIVHPLAHSLFPVSMADGIHTVNETVELGDHRFKGLSFN